MNAKELGIAVVGSGRIGTLRARLAAKHPAVRFLAVSDKDPAQAARLAELAGADFHSADNDAAIAHPRVNAVFVSTPEGEHAAPVCKALELGKPVLVEKPLALSLNDAEAIFKTLQATGGTLRVGYSRRFKECFLRAKEQMRLGRLGKVSGAPGARLQFAGADFRHPQARPARHAGARRADILRRPDELVSRRQSAGRGGRARPVGHFSRRRLRRSRRDLGDRHFRRRRGGQFRHQLRIAGELSDAGQSDRVEFLGTEGTMIIDDDHMEHLIFSEQGIPHPYVPGHAVEMAFLGSNSAGDWAMGDFWGPLGNETRAWLDFLATGRPSIHCTPEQAMLNLKTTYAIERAAATGQAVRLD